HASVSEILRQDINVYRVNTEILRKLRPTHVVTQIQCEVCAVSIRDVEAAMADWIGAAPQLVALNPQSFDDVFDDIRRTASSLGADGDVLVCSMRSRMEAIASSAPSRKPRMVIIELIEPLMVAGNWMPALV